MVAVPSVVRSAGCDAPACRAGAVRVARPGRGVAVQLVAAGRLVACRGDPRRPGGGARVARVARVGATGRGQRVAGRGAVVVAGRRVGIEAGQQDLDLGGRQGDPARGDAGPHLDLVQALGEPSSTTSGLTSQVANTRSTPRPRHDSPSGDSARRNPTVSLASTASGGVPLRGAGTEAVCRRSSSATRRFAPATTYTQEIAAWPTACARGIPGSSTCSASRTTPRG